MIRSGAIAIVAVCAACGARVPGDRIEGDDTGGPDARVDGPTQPIPDAAPPDAAPCTGGTDHTISGGSCYEAFRALPLAWTDAQTVCVGRGGALTRIDSAAENVVVQLLAGGDRAWIGGSDLTLEGTFVWTDGAPFQLTFTNWRNGEPNNGNGNFQEDCALIEAAGTWDDRPCDDNVVGAGVGGEYYYVCERSL